MSEIVLWKEQAIKKFRRDMDCLIERSVSCVSLERADTGQQSGMGFDLKESEDAIRISLCIPGIRTEDIELLVTDKSIKLTISSRSFVRTLKLPFRTRPEDVHAVLRQDALEIYIPRTSTKSSRLLKVKSTCS